MTRFARVAIIGATGPTGRALAAEYARRETPIRAISRRPDELARMNLSASAEIRAGDAMDRDSIAAAVDGCDLLVDCIGLPPAQMADHLVIARNIAAAASGVRLLQISSYWCYMPIRERPVSEKHPRTGGPAWAKLRREAEDILRQAGAAIVHLPDFFGPHVHTSTLQLPIREAVAGQTMNWIGATDIERDYIYVPDAMRLAADLAEHEEAYGADWIIPGSGPVTGKAIAVLLSDILGHRVAARGAALWLLRMIGFFNADLRSFLQVGPDYVLPLSFNGSKLDALLGPTSRTPYTDALSATVATIRQE